MNDQLEPSSGVIERPSGVRRWITKQERDELGEATAVRLALMRSIGDDSPSADPVKTWLDTIDSDNTRFAYATDVRVFIEWLRDKHGIEADDASVNLFGITRPMIAEYANYMRETTGRYGKPLSKPTRARRLSTLSAMYREFASNDYVPFNPVQDLKRPKVDADGKTPARTVEEILKMTAAARGDHRATVLLLLLFTSALRVTELCQAMTEKLAYADGEHVIIVKTKGDKSRTVVLAASVHAALETYLAGRTSGPLLLGDNGKALQRYHVPVILHRLAEKAGLRHPEAVTPHVLRTTVASMLINAGHPVQRVQYLLGHDHLATTQKYHRRTRGLQENVALVAALVAELPMADILADMRGDSSSTPTPTRRSS